MTNNIDIYRCAVILVSGHGADAPIFAALRADEMFEKGDMLGQATWVLIIKAIDEILAKDRGEGALVH